MARNIEIKAHAVNFEQQQELARSLSENGPLPLTMSQEDTFFCVNKGRLKLREFADAPAQLIFYHRDNNLGPKLSDYHITETDDPSGLKRVLTNAYGVRNIVNKTRTLYIIGQTRLHFDNVAKLGEFIELEVVLSDDQALSIGETTARHLMQQLGIQHEHLIDVAYIDLLERAS